MSAVLYKLADQPRFKYGCHVDIVSDMSYSGEAIEEKKRLYKFIFFSVFFTPAAASMVILGPLFFFGLPVAFYYLALYVLPVAFGGLAIGYFASSWEHSTEIKRLRNLAIGYLAGFVMGLNIVSLQALAAFQSSFPFSALILVAAFAGLIISFLLSKVGKSQSNYYYSYWADRCANTKYEDRNLFRRNVTLILAGFCAITIILPHIVSG